MKIIPYFFLFTIITAIPFGCRDNHCCPPPDFGYFDIYYKSAANPDLLNPLAGIYNPSEVKVDEMVKHTRGISPIPAATNPEGQYVWDYGMHDGIYFIHYNCSIIKYNDDLIMTLVELKQGVTDTLTFTYFSPNNAYPRQVFYNRKLVWTCGDAREFTIVK